MNLLRKIKFSKLIKVSFSETELEILNFINSKISNLISFQIETKPDIIFYMNSEGLYILEQDNKNDRLGVRYLEFWKVLHDKYKIQYNEVQKILKFMLKEDFKHKIGTPYIALSSTAILVEEFYKNN